MTIAAFMESDHTEQTSEPRRAAAEAGVGKSAGDQWDQSPIGRLVDMGFARVDVEAALAAKCVRRAQEARLQSLAMQLTCRFVTPLPRGWACF